MKGGAIQERQQAQSASEGVDFLHKYPPFDEIDDAELEAVVEASSLRQYEDADTILVEDGPPADCFYVVRSGAVELVHEDEVIDVIEPGEGFGHPSLLTGMAPAFTVRAHGSASCYLIPREPALRLLGTPAGLRFVATSFRERLTRTGHTVHGLREMSTVRIADLISRPPQFVRADTTIRHAAEVMTEDRVSALLVRDGSNLYIVTDGELRTKVVAAGFSPENPVYRITVPAVTVRPERLAVDAVVDMLDAGVDHLVIVEPDGDVAGVVSAEDVVGLESRSPFALRHRILRSRDEEELVAVAGELPRMFVSLLDSGIRPADVGRVLTLQGESITRRLIDFAIERHGEAPVAWAWLALGSAARQELTLASDQDNALAYDDTDDATVDEYFARVAADVNEGLARCGLGADNAEVMARDPKWRKSASQWQQIFRDTLDSPDRSNLVRAAVSFDFRHVAGGLQIVQPLVQIIQTAREHPDFLRRLARTVTDFKPPLGFRGSISSNGTIDIKKGGTMPVANLARFYAVSNGITISPTLDRLDTAAELGVLEAETAEELSEAFGITQRVRYEHHAAQIKSGETPDNDVDPKRLPPLSRLQLRDALRAVAQAQKKLGVYAPLGRG
jgi:CBS domain-containing protein